MSRATRPPVRPAMENRLDDGAALRQQLLHALQQVRSGDFSAQLPTTWTGIDGKIADTFNDIVAANRRMALELRRVGLAVGKEGRTRERVRFDHTMGAWGEMEGSVNTLTDDLLRPIRSGQHGRDRIEGGHAVEGLAVTLPLLDVPA